MQQGMADPSEKIGTARAVLIFAVLNAAVRSESQMISCYVRVHSKVSSTQKLWGPTFLPSIKIQRNQSLTLYLVSAPNRISRTKCPSNSSRPCFHQGIFRNLFDVISYRFLSPHKYPQPSQPCPAVLLRSSNLKGFYFSCCALPGLAGPFLLS